MGKRSSFARIPKDKYRTFDPRAAEALAPHLPWGCRFWEPCAARGDLIRNIQAHGAECVAATDIAPECEAVYRLDALTVDQSDVDCTGATHIITNPPWSRITLHRMIQTFAQMRPTWLLFDSDWVQTVQARMAKHGLMTVPELMRWCVKVVAVGRLRWIEGTDTDGKDNVSWHLFDARHQGPTEFIARAS